MEMNTLFDYFFRKIKFQSEQKKSKVSNLEFRYSTDFRPLQI